MDNLMSLPALDFFPHRLIVLEYQPTTPYSKAFFYFGVFIITWCFWKVFLYPQWLSPLRDMSGPTVSVMAPYAQHMGLSTISAGQPLSLRAVEEASE